MTGWTEEIDATTDRDRLPATAQAYLARIETVTGLPIEIISVGPDRAQTVRSIDPAAAMGG